MTLSDCTNIVQRWVERNLEMLLALAKPGTTHSLFYSSHSFSAKVNHTE